MKAKVSFIIILCCLVFLSTFSISVSAQDQDFELDIESAILAEAETGQILYEKNADEQLPPASITKIMTLLIAMEKVESGEISLDDEITVSRFAESMGGSQIFLPSGISVRLEDLLKAITIASANDACVAVAEAIGGSYNNFIDLMNKRAKELGMDNTYFSNSTGLPAEGKHYSTARDIVKMARELVKHEKVLEWASIWVDYIDLPERRAMLANTNKLINQYPGIDGLKTGHTDEAGFCLAATAKRDDTRLISVIMKADTELEREEITARLLDYGFNRFTKETVAEKGQQVQNIKVPDGKQIFTIGQIADDLSVMVKRGLEDKLETQIKIKEDIKAPVKKGEVLGVEEVYQDNQLLNSVDIVATENIERANIFLRIWRSFVEWIGSLISR